MTVIWKQKLVTPHNICRIPRGAEILCAQSQDDIVVIWFICDPLQPIVERVFAIVCTGDNTNVSPKHYIGTCQLAKGAFVVHVFEIPR